jgi:putative ABC transport system permease protein
MQLSGDFDFPKMFGLKLVAGRFFDPNNINDSTSIILNESAVHSLGVTPEEVIGKEVVRPKGVGQEPQRQLVRGTVVGVVEDFPYESMGHLIEPVGISPKPHPNNRIIYVKLSDDNMSEKLADLEKKWKQIFPEYGFDYWFLDEEFGRMYANEARMAGLTEKFSWLAILVGCVGLYGLASFMAEQRTKEIGIRKTMGATNGQILFLLLKVFGKLLIIASVAGVPVAYLLTRSWLESFVYRTPLSVTAFGGALVVIVVITLITVGYETLKASLANPIKALKHEG